MKTLFVGISAALFTVVSIGLKIPPALQPDVEAAPVLRPLPPILASYLKRNGYMQTATKRMTNDVVYTALIYQSPLCNGWAAALPLARNAEGAYLLKAVLNNATPQIGYIVENRHYAKFPELRFAWNRAREALRRYMEINQSPLNAHAWAIATTGDCAHFKQKTA